MGYDNSASSARQLEARFERLLLLIGDLQAAIGRLQQPMYNAAGGGFGGSSGGGVIYSMVGVVIAAGTIAAPGSVTGATVYVQVGGSGTVASTNATVYNEMQAATVASNTIKLGLNPDGTFSVISQSC